MSRNKNSNGLKTLFNAIPIAKKMGIYVDNWDGRIIRLKAPIKSNLNDKGTVFAGSLYSIAVLAGWATVTLTLRAFGIKSSIVIKGCEVNYENPAKNDFMAVCAFKGENITNGLRNKVKLDVYVWVDDLKVLSFIGNYSIKTLL